MPDDKDIPLAAIAVEEPEEAPNAKLPRRPNRFVVLWRKIGAGSLGFSLLLHAGILLFMASYFIVRQISDKQVDYNPLHDEFFPSIGCAPCTRAISLGEDFRAGRWWWETEAAKECGLHVKDSVLEKASS